MFIVYCLLLFKQYSNAYLGHLSIVNTTLIHPVLPVIATSGIERHIILHSPTSSAPWATDLQLTPTTIRPLPSGGPTPSDPSVLRLLMRLSTTMESDETMGEDARSIAYFDMCVSHLICLACERQHMRAGFCNVRAIEIYFHTGRRRCHQTMMRLTMAMMS